MTGRTCLLGGAKSKAIAILRIAGAAKHAASPARKASPLLPHNYPYGALEDGASRSVMSSKVRGLAALRSLAEF